MSKFKTLVLSCAAAATFVGCGGSDSGTTASAPTESGTSTTVKAVDPYIQDATFFYDANKNGIYDNGEQESTPSGKQGACTFSPALPEGARVVMKAKGIHVGVPFEGQLSADLSSTGVVSPITTLGTKGYSDSEVVALLEVAGILLSEDDLDKDPMAGLGDSSTADDLKKIQAAVAINTFLKLVGTGITKEAIEADDGIKTKLQNCITFSKNAITEATVTGSNLQAAVNSAVAVSNYIAADTTGEKLTTLSATDATVLNALMTTLTTQYETSTDPEATFGLDSTGGVVAVASMTASAYFNHVGTTFGLDYSDVADARGDHYNTDWMYFDEQSLIGTTFTHSYTDFGMDWNDIDKDGNRTEYLKERENGIYSVSTTTTGEIYSGTMSGTERDGTPFSGTGSVEFKIDGNVETSKWTFTSADKSVTEIEGEEEVFISAEKVTKVAGVNVAGDVYRVKSKYRYGQVDSNGNFLAIGDGWKDAGYRMCQEFSDMATYIDYAVTTGVYMSQSIKFGPNGTVLYSDGTVVADAYWRVTADDILEIRYYDEYNLKIGGTMNSCQSNWVGDTTYTFIDVTKTEANAIMKVLVPSETLIIQ